MAHESAVESPAEFETKITCSGCGEDINLLTPHLQVVVKPQRAVIESVDAALVGAETDEEGNIVSLAIDVTSGDDEIEEGRQMYYMGWKKGGGELLYFHNYDHLADYAGERSGSKDHQTKDGAVRIRANRGEEATG